MKTKILNLLIYALKKRIGPKQAQFYGTAAVGVHEINTKIVENMHI